MQRVVVEINTTNHPVNELRRFLLDHIQTLLHACRVVRDIINLTTTSSTKSVAEPATPSFVNTCRLITLCPGEQCPLGIPTYADRACASLFLGAQP